MSKVVKQSDIFKATEEYVDNFQQYDISRVVDSMLKKLKLSSLQICWCIHRFYRFFKTEIFNK